MRYCHAPRKKSPGGWPPDRGGSDKRVPWRNFGRRKHPTVWARLSTPRRQFGQAPVGRRLPVPAGVRPVLGAVRDVLVVLPRAPLLRRSGVDARRGSRVAARRTGATSRVSVAGRTTPTSRRSTAGGCCWCVTDQSSPGWIEFPTLPESRSPEARSERRWSLRLAVLASGGVVVCMVCGRSGPFIDSPRGGKRDRSRDRDPDPSALPRRALAGGHDRDGAGAAPRDGGASAQGGVTDASRLPGRAGSIRIVGFVRETLEKYPRLRATRLWQMLRERGCTLRVRQVRRQGGRAAADCRTRRSCAGGRLRRKRLKWTGPASATS